MKGLENLKKFEILNNQSLAIIKGGIMAASKKKDVNTTSGDSFKKDNSVSTDSYKRDSLS